MAPTAGPSRRSSRIRAAQEARIEQFDAPESETEPEPTPPRKRRKADGKPGKVTRRRKTLSKLPDMPLDILYEIFGMLHLRDILQLSKTTKALRRMLMDRSATTVWMQARQNVIGLPELPADLTERQYAHLLYHPFCHFCHHTRVANKFVIWQLRVRACKACFNEDNFPDLETVENFFLDCPVSVLVMMPAYSKKDGGPVFLQRDVDELASFLREFQDDLEKLKELETKYVAKVAMIHSTGDALDDWQCDQDTQRAEELDELRKLRRAQVLTKISDNGFGDELAVMGDNELLELTEQTWMKQPKELTERGWTNIKAEVLAYMERIKANRIADDLRLRMEQRMIALKPTILAFKRSHQMERLPLLVDFYTTADVLANVLVDTENTAEILTTLTHKLPEACRRWEELAIMTLMTVMPQPHMDPSTLQLATTWFRHDDCDNCHLSFPNVLYEYCPSHTTLSDLVRNPPTCINDIWISCLGATKKLPWIWRVERLNFDDVASDELRDIIALCGKDPDATTAQTMDELDARFLCLPCSDVATPQAMGWRAVVQHIHSERHCDFADQSRLGGWAVLNAVDTALVKQAQTAIQGEQLQEERIWNCLLCMDDTKMTWDAAVEHWHIEHDETDEAEELEEGVNCRLALDAFYNYQHPPPYNCPYPLIRPYLEAAIVAQTTEQNFRATWRESADGTAAA